MKPTRVPVNATRINAKEIANFFIIIPPYIDIE